MTKTSSNIPKQVLLWFSVILIIAGVGLLGYGLNVNGSTGLIGIIVGVIGLFLLLITQFIRNR